MPELDPVFLALPLSVLTDAALTRATELGCDHADVRVERLLNSYRTFHDLHLESSTDYETLGICVRVVHSGVWGFAAGIDLTPDAAAHLVDRAVATAKVSRPLTPDTVLLSPEPTYPDATWVSSYDINPFDVDESEKQGRILDLCDRLLSASGVSHTSAGLWSVQENKYFANLAGTSITQQRVRLQPQITAVSVGDFGFATMRTLAPPVGRGWEYLTGTGYDFDAEIARLPEHLAEHVSADSVQPGRYDLVIDPSNLFLTIHESIGHATELDRALGYESAYAGTSFATFDQLGTLHYGSPVMNVTGDRVVDHGLSTIGYDDEGVAAQQFDIIGRGTLVGYQLNRQMAAAKGLGRSNGCAFADSPSSIPMQRMPNVSLQPDPAGPSTDELISGGRSGHLHRRRQVVVDRHAALQLPVHRAAVLPDREGQAGRPSSRTWPTRRPLPTSGGRWRRSATRRPTCSAAPSTVARASRARWLRCPTASPAALFRRVNVLNTQAEGSPS